MYDEIWGFESEKARFAQLHRNEWVSSESRFIDPGLWDQNINPTLRQEAAGSLFIGIDASVKHSSTALVAVEYDGRFGDRLVLAFHRIWVPTPGNPMDFEATIEFYLRRLEGYQHALKRLWSTGSRCTGPSRHWNRLVCPLRLSRRLSLI